MCAVSLEDLINAKKAAAIKGSKYLPYLKTTAKFDPKYSDIRQIVKSFDAAEELKNLDTRIDQIIAHLLTFPCFKDLKQLFPFKNVWTQKSKKAQENAVLLGVSSAIRYFNKKGTECYIGKKNNDAILYFRLAAKENYRDAMFNLGVLLQKKGTLDTK